MDSDSKFLFSKDSKPNEGDYKTLKKVCARLGIPYGTYQDGGFVPHDLPHNFASEVIRGTDMETAKNLTRHSGTHILTYLHTDEKRMREALNRREGREMREELTALYNLVKDGKIEISAFIERVENLTKNG